MLITRQWMDKMCIKFLTDKNFYQLLIHHFPYPDDQFRPKIQNPESYG